MQSRFHPLRFESIARFALLGCALLVCQPAGLLSQPGWAVQEAAATEGLGPAEAVSAFTVAAGLQVTLFASEPDIASVSNLDVDQRGRVWVCEGVNYGKNYGQRPAGDRIVILEDTNQDGHADKRTVFYQGHDVDIAMGLCVLGNRAIVSAAPDIFLLTDTNGDDRADKKEILLTSSARPRYDHSLHSLVFGPDGRWYFNFGNAGKRLADRAGKTLVDVRGDAIEANGKPYREGMVVRCSTDFSRFEVLGHNFRNPYEVTIDSLGNLWQSDNDDDGHAGVRINAILEGGNYGYRDERTGAGWSEPRIGQHPEERRRHWHQNDPGSIPNLLQTGAGAPACMTVYEGRLLPKPFWDQLIHCDAGVRLVRAYPVVPEGAGFRARSLELLSSSDGLFRPIDVAVAPDGSLLVSDWYDPVVGGLLQRDTERGRVYRLAPAGLLYTVPPVDLTTPSGAAAALLSPNACSRALAWQKLHALGLAAEPALQPIWHSSRLRHRARALWLLGQIAGRQSYYIRQALEDPEPDIRIVGLRLARLLDLELVSSANAVAQDQSPRVRAEAAIVLRDSTTEAAARVWAELARQHDGRDRWYLEALGIGASAHWDACLAAWLKRVDHDWRTPAGRDILWRSRARITPTYLAMILSESGQDAATLRRYVRALDFVEGPEKDSALMKLVTDEQRLGRLPAEIFAALARRAKPLDLATRPGLRQHWIAALVRQPVTRAQVVVADRYDLVELYPQLLASARAEPASDLSTMILSVLLAKGQADTLRRAIRESGPDQALSLLTAVCHCDQPQSQVLLEQMAHDTTFDLPLRRAAARGTCQFPQAARQWMDQKERGTLAEEFQGVIAAALLSHPRPAIRQRAERLFPSPPSKDKRPLPTLARLVGYSGDAARGRTVFQQQGTCTDCHRVGKLGKQVGPDLSQIGTKLSRSALFEAIVYPSAGINHNDQNQLLLLDDGRAVTGILTSSTDTRVAIQGADGVVHHFSRDQIEQLKPLSQSLMPANLVEKLTVEQLVDLVEYLSTLRAR